MRTQTKSPCYCGQLVDCEDCGRDTCACTCEVDGAPQTREESTSGWAPRTTHHDTAYAQKMELRR